MFWSSLNKPLSTVKKEGCFKKALFCSDQRKIEEEEKKKGKGGATDFIKTIFTSKGEWK